MNLNDEEKFAIKMLFSTSDAISLAVCQQINQMEVISRRATGVGFFTTINAKKQLPKSVKKIWDWNFEHKHLSYGGSFICWIEENSRIELEGVVHNGEWPSNFNEMDFVEK